MFSPSCFLFGEGGDMLSHNRLHFLGRCCVSPAQSPTPVTEGWLGTGLRCGVGLKPQDALRCLGCLWIYGLSCFLKGALWYHGKQEGFCSFCWSIGEAERFAQVIAFRVVFEVTFKQLKPFKKRSPPYHTHGKPALMNTRRKQFLWKVSKVQGYQEHFSALFFSSLLPGDQKPFPRVVQCYSFMCPGRSNSSEGEASVLLSAFLFLFLCLSFSKCSVFLFFPPILIPFSSSLFSEQQQAYSILCIIFL